MYCTDCLENWKGKFSKQWMFKINVMQYQIEGEKAFYFLTANMLMKGKMSFIYILMKHSEKVLWEWKITTLRMRIPYSGANFFCKFGYQYLLLQRKPDRICSTTLTIAIEAMFLKELLKTFPTLPKSSHFSATIGFVHLNAQKPTISFSGVFPFI